MSKQISAGELLLYSLGMGECGAATELAHRELEQLTSSGWDEVIRGAMACNVAPLLYHRLKAFNLDGVMPMDAGRKLRESYLCNAVKNMKLYQDLSRVARAFQSNGLPVMVLKGAHLAKVVYGNIALRKMCDLDLLVKESDLPGAIRILLDMGYSPVDPFTDEDIALLRLPVFIRENATPIEIHWHIKYANTPFFIDIDGLWERARPVVINDVQMLVLSPEDLILHLCLHAAHHILKIGLRPFCDLFEAISHYRNEIDWEQVRLRSRKWKMDRPLSLMFHLLGEFSGKPELKELINVLEVNPVGADLVPGLREHIIMKLNSPSLPTFHLTNFWTSRGLKGKAAFLQKSIFPSRQYMAKRYHLRSDSKRVYFYYLVRLHDAFLRYRPVVWRLCLRDREMTALIKVDSRQIATQKWLMSV
ncbi:MAG: nucleotidyltransferase family protein [bacterium]